MPTLIERAELLYADHVSIGYRL